MVSKLEGHVGGSASLWLRQKNRKMQETCVFTVATKEKDGGTARVAKRRCSGDGDFTDVVSWSSELSVVPMAQEGLKIGAGSSVSTEDPASQTGELQLIPRPDAPKRNLGSYIFFTHGRRRMFRPHQSSPELVEEEPRPEAQGDSWERQTSAMSNSSHLSQLPGVHEALPGASWHRKFSEMSSDSAVAMREILGGATWKRGISEISSGSAAAMRELLGGDEEWPMTQRSWQGDAQDVD